MKSILTDFKYDIILFIILIVLFIIIYLSIEDDDKDYLG